MNRSSILFLVLVLHEGFTFPWAPSACKFHVPPSTVSPAALWVWFFFSSTVSMNEIEDEMWVKEDPHCLWVGLGWVVWLTMKIVTNRHTLTRRRHKYRHTFRECSWSCLSCQSRHSHTHLIGKGWSQNCPRYSFTHGGNKQVFSFFPFDFVMLSFLPCPRQDV